MVLFYFDNRRCNTPEIDKKQLQIIRYFKKLQNLFLFMVPLKEHLNLPNNTIFMLVLDENCLLYKSIACKSNILSSACDVGLDSTY